MRIKQKQISLAVLHALSLSVAVGVSGNAFAQQAAAPQTAEKIATVNDAIAYIDSNKG